jgi:DNA-binding response OmpR family regulator
MPQAIRPINILLIEDNPGDVRLTREVLLEGKIFNRLNVVIDGVEALKYLNREDEYKNVPIPDLILLDLKLPKLDGREVLQKIKEKENLKNIPVIILTSSEDENDMLKSYNLGVDYYFTKPLNLEQFLNVIKVFDTFWISFVKLDNE